jgi:hypothetical protein
MARRGRSFCRVEGGRPLIALGTPTRLGTRGDWDHGLVVVWVWSEETIFEEGVAELSPTAGHAVARVLPVLFEKGKSFLGAEDGGYGRGERRQVFMIRVRRV